MVDLIGSRLGNYELISVLGTGGMAKVYRARQLNVQRDVAIKVIESALALNPEFSERFEREANLVANLNHPHILKLFDYGNQDGLLYLVMELQPSGSLADVLRRGPLALEHIARILDQIGSALDFAHREGIIHRDLKPQNVLFDKMGNAILADFGVARVMGEITTRTQAGTVMGTPAYMAPEQWQAWPLDGRVDIYSMGIMLFEMLTGNTPFDAETPFQVMHGHVNRNPPPLRTVRPDLPSNFDDVLQKALAKDRDLRFNTASELAAAFRAALTATPSDGTRKHTAANGTHAASGPARTTPLLTIFGAAAAISLAIIVLLLIGVSRSSPVEPTATRLNDSAALVVVLDTASPTRIPPSLTNSPTRLPNTATSTPSVTPTTSPSATASIDTRSTLVMEIAQTSAVKALTASAVASPTLQPTSTLTPTLTITASPTLTFTASFTATASATPTPSLTNTPQLPLPRVGVYRPSEKALFIYGLEGQDPTRIPINVTPPRGIVLVGDWDGDGVATVGIYDPDEATFALYNTNSTGGRPDYSFTLANPDSIPMVGDWDGDGKEGVAVFNPRNSLISVKNRLEGSKADFGMVYGNTNDVGLGGDWDGDGVDTPGVFRASNATFYLTNKICKCNVFSDIKMQFGRPNDVPLAGDWRHSGKTGIGVFRRTEGKMYLNDGLGPDVVITFGQPNDRPIIGKLWKFKL